MLTCTEQTSVIVCRQQPASGTFEPLRRSQQPFTITSPIDIVPGTVGHLPSLTGDALEVVAVFSVPLPLPLPVAAGVFTEVTKAANGTAASEGAQAASEAPQAATSFGLSFRVGNFGVGGATFMCNVGYVPRSQSLTVTPGVPSWSVSKHVSWKKNFVTFTLLPKQLLAVSQNALGCRVQRQRTQEC